MSGLTLAWLGFACTMAFFVLWMFLIFRVAMGQGRRVLLVLVVGSLVLAVGALFSDPTDPGTRLAGISLGIGGLFLFLNAITAQSKQGPAIAVGGPLLDFSALDENGEPFELASLRGQPVLLKFFRGHW